jgi:hypothetical protein
MPDNVEVVVRRGWSRASQVLRKLLIGIDLSELPLHCRFFGRVSRTGKPPTPSRSGASSPSLADDAC